MTRTLSVSVNAASMAAAETMVARQLRADKINGLVIRTRTRIVDKLADEFVMLYQTNNNVGNSTYMVVVEVTR